LPYYILQLYPAGEIRGLQVKDINLDNLTITIRALVKKNPADNKSQIVDIDKNLAVEFKKLNLTEYLKITI